MGHPPQQSASLPLTWESIWGKMFTLRCEKRGRQKSHRKSVVGNGQEMGFSLLVHPWLGQRCHEMEAAPGVFPSLLRIFT